MVPKFVLDRRRLAILCCLGLLAAPAPAEEVRVVPRPEASRGIRHYPSNRPPLAPSPLAKLPLGAVRPEGWLREQLRLQAAGFHGHLGEISNFLRKEGNSWLDPNGQGDHGWEEVPYWLKGFADCARLIGDEAQVREANAWIEAALASQAPDGFFGPRGAGAKPTVDSTKGKYDLWPNMVMLHCLMSHQEATGDDRVIPFMTKYFRWQLALSEEDFLPPYWQQQRGADNLWAVYWLFNRTGEPWLLELAEKTHRRTADWTGGMPSWHNVNIAQGFGGPAFFFAQSNDRRHLDAAERNYREVRRRYGNVPGGMFGGDENCRPGKDDPRQAVETCGMVEMMFSCERLMLVTGDPVWADRGEDVAFNSLPAALTADLKALRYLTAPNLAVSDRRDHAPGFENPGPMLHMNPHLHRCCQHNFGHGWPYLAQHLWMAAPGDGLAAAFYAASRVTARVGDGTEVTIEERTDYPFDGRIELELRTADPMSFPLYLRIPHWCNRPALSINGQARPLPPNPRGYLLVERRWQDGDVVTLDLPIEVSVRKWERNHGSVSVGRGPLTFALKIEERMHRQGGTDAWPAWEILPESPWNYGLVLDGARPAASFEVVRRDGPIAPQPWTPEAAPISLKARARAIPAWRLDRYGLVAELQDSPVRTDEPEQSVTLIPMGAARLRISAFPVIGDGPDAREWVPPEN